jgi:AraC-like DNA-binding protein
VPLAVPGAARVQGREADEGSFFVLQGGEEFMFHMPNGMDLLAITFDREAFEQAVASAPQPDEVQTLLKQPVLQIPPSRLGESRRRLLGLFERALMSADVSAPEKERWLEGALMAELVDLLSAPECDKRQRHGSSPGSYIVEKCHRLTMDDRLNPPSVIDLCQRLRVSRRSVQNGFRSVAETTAVNYIRCIRLNGVRRALMSTSSTEESIGDAAARWGFYHLSHFAADYQQLFGELPSQTRRADGATGRPVAKANSLD